MIRTQIQFPDPLYRRLKAIAEQQDWSLAEVKRKAAEQFVTRFPESERMAPTWSFPTLDFGGDFLADPESVSPETEAITLRSER